jgi:ubiquinone/menaquinone biosynthesis C-methylase UbiE
MESPRVHSGNADQSTYWNGPAGHRWMERQQTQDLVLGPIQDILLERAAAVPGKRVIDIGCGCGATTIALAQRVAPNGHVTGIDISEPMLARARELAPAELPVEFILADATVHPFERGITDLLFSRFGVMFFANPTLSFQNLRTALRSGGRVVFGCWREPRNNPWMLAPLQEAYKHVPRLPEVGPEDPGPFAFADEQRVRRILGEAGFSSIALEQIDLTIDIAAGRGLDNAVRGALEIGPVSRALAGHSPEVIEKVGVAIRAALAAHQKGQTVPLGASIWVITARNGA